MKTIAFILLICLLSILFPNSWHDVHANDKMTSPTLNNGKKWRIGYYEGGPWRDYRESLRVTVEGLMNRGWIEKEALPATSISDQPGTQPLWHFLASSIKSPYIEFVADAFWTSEWKADFRNQNRENCIKRLQEHYVDLVFAMGTWAGKDLANTRHSVPTMVMSTSDPVQSGIIKSSEDSGIDHVHARCDPKRYQRQIQLFHDIIQFRRVGVVYNDTDPNGRVLSHIDKLEEVGRERGFEVIPCTASDSLVSLQTAVEGYRACVQKLAPRVDAFYLSDLRGTEPDMLWDTIQPLIHHKVPTWSARGSTLVERGALLSIARENFDFLAPFYSMVVARIFHGDKPRHIPQVIQEKLRLSINRETARMIEYQIPPNVLKVADIVYDQIVIPETKQ